jgi:uncharacterized protein (DUF488 family)
MTDPRMLSERVRRESADTAKAQLSSAEPLSGSLSGEVVTIGHGTLDASAFVELAHRAGLELIVDVRSYPGSRHVPQFGREALSTWLPDAGVAYRWEPELGGRRKPVSDSKHVALRHQSFRAYADYMETQEFRTALTGVIEDAARVATAVMCSESVWWRCHRRLVADQLVLIDRVAVVHLFHDGRTQAHPPLTAARVDGDRLVYDII